MKNTVFIKNIRKDLCVSLFFPLLLLVLFTSVLNNAPRDNYLSPRPVNHKSNFENFYNRDLPHVTVSVPSLKYSGLDYLVDGQAKGHYYYSLAGGRCQFYLLTKEAGSPPARELTNLQLKGRLIRLNQVEYESILTHMAQVLNWTPDSLDRMATVCAVTTLPYPAYLNIIFYAVLYGGIVIATADLLCLLFFLAEPLRAPALRYLGTFRERRAFLSGQEPEAAPLFSSGSLYLSRRYFAGRAKNGYVILPLFRVAQVYYTGSRHDTDKRHLPRLSTLCITLHTGKNLRFPNIKDSELKILLNGFREGDGIERECVGDIDGRVRS